MISLTTTVGDVVLDPFAGIGSVPAMASALGRRGHGFEISSEFTRILTETVEDAQLFLRVHEMSSTRRDEFRKLIIELRLLKLARIIAKRLAAAGFPVEWAFVRKQRRKPTAAYAIASAELSLAITGDTADNAAQRALELLTHPPLSKFGIDVSLRIDRAEARPKRGYWWQDGRFWNAPSRKPGDEPGPWVGAPFKPKFTPFDETPEV